MSNLGKCEVKGCDNERAIYQHVCKDHLDKDASTLKEVEPSHYHDIYPVEVFELMKGMFKECYGAHWKRYYEGFLIGNEWKYRLRAGFKGDSITDIEKAKRYNAIRKANESC